MPAAYSLHSDHDALADNALSEYMATNDECREIFDCEAQRQVGISGDAFVRRWHAGEYPDWDPELSTLVMMLPFLGEWRTKRRVGQRATGLVRDPQQSIDDLHG